MVKKSDSGQGGAKRKSSAPEGLALGVDIGGTGIKSAVSDAAGSVLGRGKVRTGAEEGTKAILKRIEQAAEEACAEAGIRLTDLELAGVAAPGAVDHRRGVVLEAVNLHWEDFPLHDVMEQRLGVPVAVDNDVTAAIFAENVLGAGEDSRDVLGIWVGTGIGGGLILNGDVYHGHFLTAGEVGRGVVLPWAPPGSGTLDQICSRTGIVDTIKKLLHSGRDSVLGDAAKKDEKISSKQLARAYESGDELVVEVVEHAATVLGTALGGMVTLLSLGRVVIGGGLTQDLGKPFIEIVRRATRRSAFPDRCKAVQVVASRLGDDAGPLGAALIARRRLGDDGKDGR